MGNCMGNPNSSSKHKKLQQCEIKQLTHLQLDDQAEYPFTIELSNIKILNSPTQDIFLGLEIDGLLNQSLQKEGRKFSNSDEFEENSKKSQHSKQLKWDRKILRECSLTQKQISMKYLSVKILDKNFKIVQQIKENLYLIAVGPIHHSITVTFQDKEINICFDCKISQIVQSFVEITQLTLKIGKQYSNKLLKFSLKATYDGDEKNHSNFSSALPIPMDSIQETNQKGSFFETELASPIKMKNRIKKEASDSDMKTIKWIDSNKSMPNFILEIDPNTMAKYSIQIIIWACEQIDELSDISYFGEANIPLWKLLNCDSREEDAELLLKRSTKIEKIKIKEKMICLDSEKVYSHSQVVGSCSSTVKIRHQHFLKQNKYFVKTESGTRNNLPALQNLKVSSVNISKTSQKIFDQLDKIDKLIYSKEKSYQLRQSLNKVNEILDLTYSQSLQCVYYSGDSLAKSQQVSLLILQRLFKYLPFNDNKNLQKIGWHLILNVVKRGQFYLQNMHMNVKYLHKHKKDEIDSIIKKKIEIGLNYQQILYKLLMVALQFSSSSSYDSIEQIDKFKAFCYFRIPNFRDFILDVVETKEKQSIQNILQEFQKNIEPITSKTQNHKIRLTFSWESEFYHYLDKEPKSKKINRQLEKWLKNSEWISDLSTNNDKLLIFAKDSIKNLIEIEIGTNPEKWRYFPGYNKIVCFVLAEMKKYSISQYSPELIITSLSLLDNEHLISILMPIVCDQTNKYDFENVSLALDLLEEYFDYITKYKKQSFPTTFSNQYFFNLLKIVLQEDHCYYINKILMLIYNFLEFFNEASKNNISLYLLGKPFFKLFCHWSADIRKIFHTLLVIKIKHSNFDNQIQSNKENFGEVRSKQKEILNRFDKVTSIMKIAAKEKKKIDDKKHFQNRQLFKIMKKKVQEKRKNKQKNIPHIGQYLKLSNLQSILNEQHKFVKSELKITSNENHFENKSMLQLPTRFSQESSNSYGVKSLKTSPNFDELQTPVNLHQIQSDSVGKNQLEVPIVRKRRLSVVIPEEKQYIKKFVRNITCQLYQLSQIEPEAEKYLIKAFNQFDGLIQSVELHIFKHNKIPTGLLTLKNSRKIND